MPQNIPETYLNQIHDKHSTSQNRADTSLNLQALGVCAGPSLRSIECALVRCTQEAPSALLHVKLLKYEEFTIHYQLRIHLLDLIHDARTQPSSIPRIHTFLANIIAGVLERFYNDDHSLISSVDFISAHIGPESLLQSLPASNEAYTSVKWDTLFASKTGITTVSNFSNDYSKLDGHYSPLFGHINNQLFWHPTKLRVCIDINDFASITIIHPGTMNKDGMTISQNCGPGTMLIDYAMRFVTCNEIETDVEGLYGARGNANHSVMNRFLNAHDYIGNGPPIQMLTEMFGDHEAQRLVEECLFLGMPINDTIATITHITAHNLVRQYRTVTATCFPADAEVDDLFISGSGAKNRSIIDIMRNELSKSVIVRPLDDVETDGCVSNSVKYALLGFQIVLEKASRCFTGNKDQVQGKITHGKKWEVMLQEIIRFEKRNPSGWFNHFLIEGHSFSPLRSAIPISGLLNDAISHVVARK